MMRHRRRAPAPSSVYREAYFLSDACEGFEEYLQGTLSRVKRQEISMLDVSAGVRVLDIGCGRGEVVAALSEAGACPIAIDVSPEALRLTRSRTGGSVPLVLADAAALPFRADAFDRVLLGDVIEHIPWPQALDAMREVGRVLTADGYAIVHTAPNAWFAATIVPLMKVIAPLLGSRANRLRSRLADYAERRRSMHPNELSPLSLRKIVAASGLEGSIWIDPDVLRSGESIWSREFAASSVGRFVGRVAGHRALRWLMGNDLYARARRLSREP